MPKAYYNEFDPYAAQWLRNLISAGHIAPGDVDQRSIEDVKPNDLNGYTQCHFFAGIGVWSYALRRAGWDDSRPIWTGSCPCQPFSTAGKGNGFSDERHLWPAWFHLISQQRPHTIFGEQVASNDGLAWLDLVQTDLEAAGYARGAVDLCAAGVGAPHIRQRLWFVANTSSNRQFGQKSSATVQTGWESEPRESGKLESGFEGRTLSNFGETSDLGIITVADSDQHGLQGSAEQILRGTGRWKKRNAAGCSRTSLVEQQSADPVNGFWANSDWLLCRDGKWRPVESGTFPLVDGATPRMGRLRAYGNAINAEAAEVVIRAYMECQP